MEVTAFFKQNPAKTTALLKNLVNYSDSKVSGK